MLLTRLYKLAGQLYHKKRADKQPLEKSVEKFYRIYNTPLPPLLEARAVGVKTVPRSETWREVEASPIEPPRNLIPPELVTSQVPEQVVVAARLRFPSIPGQKPGPPTDS